jgi:tRNA(Ile)-lysidine synthase
VAALVPPVAATRSAVRDCVSTEPEGSLVLVACSGGADSLALATAAAFVAPRMGLRAGLVTVDHALQAGSADRADDLVKWATTADLDPAVAVVVDASATGDGPEAAARTARYRALATVAIECGASAVLLGHTRDDQAETVLLALSRGSGPRGIAGMPERRSMHGVTFMRPFLDISREQTVAACVALGEVIWDDPHNHNPTFTRVRVREAMPTLVAALGADVVTNLARTAALVAHDVTALDEIAAAATADIVAPDGSANCAALSVLPAAIRTRVIRSFALGLGTSGGALSRSHIAALDALVMAWHGQGPVSLPGGLHVGRHDGRLIALA